MRLLLDQHALVASNQRAAALVAGINASQWLAAHERAPLSLGLELPPRSKQPAETRARFQARADALVERAIGGRVESCREEHRRGVPSVPQGNWKPFDTQVLQRCDPALDCVVPCSMLAS